MSSSGSGRNDPQPTSTTGSKSAQTADAPSSDEQDLGKENHEQKIKSVCHDETLVPGKVSAKMTNPVNGVAARGNDLPDVRNPIAASRTSAIVSSERSPSPVTATTALRPNLLRTRWRLAAAAPAPRRQSPSHQKVDIRSRSESQRSMAPTTFEPVNAPLRPANPAMSREVIRKEEKPDEKEPASTRTQFEVVNAAVRPAECHGPLNPKKKLVKPTKEPKEDASEREQRTDAVAVREKPGASVTQYKIVYSASKGKQIPRYIPDPAPTNPNNNTTAPPIIANPPSPAQAPPSPEPPKATSSPTNEHQAKVEDKDTPTSCYMFYQR